MCWVGHLYIVKIRSALEHCPEEPHLLQQLYSSYIVKMYMMMFCLSLLIPIFILVSITDPRTFPTSVVRVSTLFLNNWVIVWFLVGCVLALSQKLESFHSNFADVYRFICFPIPYLIHPSYQIS